MCAWVAPVRDSVVWLSINSLREWQADSSHECFEGVMSMLGRIRTAIEERDSKEKVTRWLTVSNLGRGDFLWLMV